MKRKVFKSVTAAGLLVCMLTTAAARPICPPGSGQWCGVSSTIETSVSTASMTALEQEACRLINRQRRAHGLPALTIDESLSSKARLKSRDMKTNRYFSHNSPTYGSPFQMMKQLGISYRSAGENIAKGYSTASAVVNAWMASDSHRNNILSPNYTTMGIGYVDGYWTQWFIR